MGRFRAILFGETDNHTVSREFSELAPAIAWLRGDGLEEYDDQTARGEVHEEERGVVWAQSHLQSAATSERDEKANAHRLLAGLGFNDGRLEPAQKHPHIKRRKLP
jgi:hypothetical protein